MKTTMKITIIAMIGISLGIKAQHNYDNQDIIYSNDGNVGIGTSTPSAKLDVEGSAIFRDAVISNTIRTKSGVEVLNYTPSGRSFSLHLNSDTMMHFDTGGKRILSLSNSQQATFYGGLETRGDFRVTLDGHHNYLEVSENLFKVKFGTPYVPVTAIEATPDEINLNLPVITNDLNVKGSASFSGSFVIKNSAGSAPNLMEVNDLNSVFKSKTGLAYQTTLELDAQKAKFSIPVEVRNNLVVKNGFATGDLLNVNESSTTFKYLDGLVSKTTLELGGQKALFSVPVEVNGTTTIDGDLVLLNPNRMSPSRSIILRNVYGEVLNINNGGAVFRFQDGRSLADALEMNANRAKFNIRVEAVNANFNGKVGIGTATTGNHKLAVEGSIGAREIKVEATGWSDFVFYDDYQLPTLEEVEAHIQKKGHLKDVPSEEEIKKNGFYLGEMDAKLLQKIEELTLYTIEQEKKIKKLELQQKKIEKLEALIKQLLKEKE